VITLKKIVDILIFIAGVVGIVVAFLLGESIRKDGIDKKKESIKNDVNKKDNKTNADNLNNILS